MDDLGLEFPIGIGEVMIFGARIDAGEGNRPGGRREAEKVAVAEALREAGIEPSRLRHEESGRPYLEGCDREISISHGAGWAIVALGPAGMQIGVDIERWRPQLRRVSSKFLSPEEAAVYGQSDRLLLEAWTQKEAIFKAAGDPELTISRIPLPSPDFDVTIVDRFPDAVIALAIRR